MQLRIPGPTPCPPEALRALSKQMINHRGKEFGKLLNLITARLKQVFQTTEDVFLLTCSGTGGLEAAIVNTLSPGDKVLSISNGFFGDRFAEIAEQYGAKVSRLAIEWGKPVDPEAVAKALKADKGIKAVLATHNESSTGLTNNIREISAVVKELDKLLLVDAVSSLGSIDLPVDLWRCDVVVTASQKGWMVPPGLAMVSVSKNGWQAYSEAKMPRYYFDFGKAKNYLERGQTPWTPAVSVCYALDATLDLMLSEGLTNIFARHARVAQIAREGIKSMGLSLFPQEDHASNTVTAANAADKINASKLIQILRDEYDVVIAGGQQKLSGKIFRIGHLGFVYEKDIKLVLEALSQALPKAMSS
ncbi:MAG: aminotransferase [Chloroflexi bacterium CG_4_9_14_3_um_filter_45_9]|nr:MAG: class V aminotransferase [Dehalococcoidia bacterium CG2_30_46_9]PIU23644.1 MAG: aminotransferase [Chloroflexi bacterium CG08_land_8_20_14_0_20_45_12]PIX27134.1 MAG: aminotransferase [Chloroflexi bacterium CG_4_8_14_3_um_filter_45_15]PJB49198.1 MAG: aminotransferase [Chloroflexi bacterium CG_4_9_14_3_um_filter_45_9]